jgi:hypothetical protein
MCDACAADRPEEHSHEPAVSARAEHEHLRAAAFPDQHAGCTALEHRGAEPRGPFEPEDLLGGLIQDPAGIGFG